MATWEIRVNRSLQRGPARGCDPVSVVSEIDVVERPYLGEVQVPDGFRPALGTLFSRGDMMLAVIQDRAGTIMVKRYRLVLPAER